MAVDTFTFSSSMLAAGAYDDETRTLTLSFINGREYDLDLEPEEWAAFKAAPSPGRYFNDVLKGR